MEICHATKQGRCPDSRGNSTSTRVTLDRLYTTAFRLSTANVLPLCPRSGHWRGAPMARRGCDKGCKHACWPVHLRDPTTTRVGVGSDEGQRPRKLSATGAATQARSSAALQSQHLVSVVLKDGVAVAKVVRGDIGLLYLRGVIIQMCLGFRILTSPCGENRRHLLYFVMVLW
jgi:hypothetical protein